MNEEYRVLKITPSNCVAEWIMHDGPEVVGKFEECNTRLSSTCLGFVETLLLHEIALKCTIMWQEALLTLWEEIVVVQPKLQPDVKHPAYSLQLSVKHPAYSLQRAAESDQVLVSGFLPVTLLLDGDCPRLPPAMTKADAESGHERGDIRVSSRKNFEQFLENKRWNQSAVQKPKSQQTEIIDCHHLSVLDMFH